MSLDLKNKHFWGPSASLANLKDRSTFLKAIRHFFELREVMEVDVPLLSFGVATDPCLDSFLVEERYLQTSPEFPMKRLIAAGCGPIYYLGKAFRRAEVGYRHNPEFTILEWYRPKWNHLQLIEEVDELFSILLNTSPAKRYTYHALFEERFAINPHKACIDELKEIALKNDWVCANDCPTLDNDGWLDLLLVNGIEPHLGQSEPTLILDYPASQASLAKTRIVEGEEYSVAERFEFYYRGIELANGYHELSCAHLQHERFEDDRKKRKALDLNDRPIDHLLIEAISHGFPQCAGVAIGVDRLLMLKLNESHIAKVIPFSWERS